MDKIFIVFVLAVLFIGGAVFVSESLNEGTTDVLIPKTTVLQTTSTTIDATTSTVHSTTTTTKLTTTTTLFVPPEFISLNYTHLDKCRDTELGKMNKVLVELTHDQVNGTWIGNNSESFILTCDAKQVGAHVVVNRGGGNLQKGQELAGIYRLMTKCGRNQPIGDLKDCRELSISFATGSQNITAVYNTPVDIVPVANSTSVTSFTFPKPPTTTTMIYHNPYLDKFKEQGYRKATLEIHWLCPSCVPAVNRVVMGEPGVKSRSLMYKQRINYVIYDPQIVDLERVIELAGAGGDVELVNDTEM